MSFKIPIEHEKVVLQKTQYEGRNKGDGGGTDCSVRLSDEISKMDQPPLQKVINIRIHMSIHGYNVCSRRLLLISVLEIVTFVPRNVWDESSVQIWCVGGSSSFHPGQSGLYEN